MRPRRLLASLLRDVRCQGCGWLLGRVPVWRLPSSPQWCSSSCRWGGGGWSVYAEGPVRFE